MPVKVLGSLPLPAGRMQQTSCLGIDFGGSVLKIVYKDKRDSQNVPGKVKVKIISFPGEEYKEALEYLKERADIRATSGSKPTVMVTGMGCTVHGQEIEEALGVTLKNMVETDAFVKAMNFLVTSLPKEDIVEPSSKDIEEEANKTAETMVATLSAVKKKGLPGMDVSKTSSHKNASPKSTVASNKTKKPYSETEDIYPCLLGSLGSAFVLLALQKDGSYTVVEWTALGGRSLLGLGSLLTGAKSYEELLDLAQKGDERRVHNYYADIMRDSAPSTNSDTDPNLLVDTMPDVPTLLFGKTVHKEISDFSKSDLARALLHAIATNTVHFLHLVATGSGYKHVFLAGGFSENPLTRDIMTYEHVYHKSRQSLLTRKEYDVDVIYMKFGSHFGALGALLSQ